MGKALVIIFGIVTAILVPISIFYVADNSGGTPNFTIELQGRLYDAKFGEFEDAGFGFFTWVKGKGIFFTPQAWNDAFTADEVWGLPCGTFMMILWYVALGLSLIGIIVAFFKPKISGIFFLLTAVADGFQSLIWFFGIGSVYAGNPDILYFPIPVSALFMLITAIIAFTTKKKESYYYSPGYSYGYGRR